MAFHMTFSTDNATFEDGAATESCRILREIADRIERKGDLEGVIFDANGNNIGAFVLNDA